MPLDITQPNGTPFQSVAAEKATVRAKVYAKYPQLRKKGGK